jgi:hypothetical protein
LALLTAVASQGAVIAVNSRAALNGNDFIDWSNLGGPFTMVANPFNINSANGNTVTLTDASGTFQRRNQGNGWSGNFAPGTPLLFTFGSGPTTFDFSTNISGFGFDIANNIAGASTATLDVYGPGNVLIDSIQFNINAYNDPSGPTFIGVLSNINEITRIVLSTPNNNYAIDQADIAVIVPEPGTLALLGLGLVGVGFRIRRKA